MSDEQKHGEPAAASPDTQTAQQTAANPPENGENESLDAFLRQARCLFSGSYTHGIDAKGRMIVPANFRLSLGDKFVVAPTPDFQAIALYPVIEWVREQEKFEALADIDARESTRISYKAVQDLGMISEEGAETYYITAPATRTSAAVDSSLPGGVKASSGSR